MYDDIIIRRVATVLEKKNGGPYNKKDQDKRRNQVHTLHFEKGYSAVKIAETLGVNRNTINEDIKYWYSNIKDEVKQENDDYILRQIGRLESQRSRIVEKVTENEVKDAIKYENALRNGCKNKQSTNEDKRFNYPSRNKRHHNSRRQNKRHDLIFDD